MSQIGLCILAAGKGTRMKSILPKVLAPICGKKLIDFPLKTSLYFLNQLKAKSLLGLVIGHGAEDVKKYVDQNFNSENPQYALQEEQLGTAHALKTYFEKIKDATKTDYTVVICGDTPLIESDDLLKMMECFSQDKNLNAVCATFETENPYGYGRIVKTSGKGFHIVEEKDATNEERKILEVNSGLYIFKTNFIVNELAAIKSENKSKEFYLTDAFKDSYDVQAVNFFKTNKFLGVNTISQLDDSASALNLRKCKELQANGVFILDAHRTFIEMDVEILSDTIIYPNTFIYGKTKISKNVVIEPGVIIKNSIIDQNVHVLANSYIEESHLKDGCQIGPFARIRPQSVIGIQAKIGNFVETKKVVLEKGVKISHLSYVGDAFIGEESNIGCGFITCNYDGANKHVTKIGKNSFIGSDCQAIAPIEIGDNTFVAAGTTISKNVPHEAFAIGRPPLSVKDDMAKKFIKKKKT